MWDAFDLPHTVRLAELLNAALDIVGTRIERLQDGPKIWQQISALSFLSFRAALMPIMLLVMKQRPREQGHVYAAVPLPHSE